jgi:hypothetical protein
MSALYPEYTVQHLTAPPTTHVRTLETQNTVGPDRHCEFLLSTNWVLRPEGLEEFYTELRQRNEVSALFIDWSPAGNQAVMLTFTR